MSRTVLALIVAVAAAAVSCATPPAETLPFLPEPGPAVSAEDVVLTEIRSYYDDFSNRDWAAFRSHFWPGATLTTRWQRPGEDSARVTVMALDDFVAQAPEGPGSREIFEERVIDAQVRVSGDLAQVWARYAARFGDPGQIMEWQGIDAFTLMRQGGRWRIVSLVFASDTQPDTEIESGEMETMIQGVTPILYVEAIEPVLPFWVDRLGFRVTTEVPEGERLGFVILQRDDAEVMVQTRASIEADVPSLADTPMGGSILFIRVDELEPITRALEGVEVLVPRRETFYGAEEIFVREPGGNVVGFAAFPKESAEG